MYAQWKEAKVPPERWIGWIKEKFGVPSNVDAPPSSASVLPFAVVSHRANGDENKTVKVENDIRTVWPWYTTESHNSYPWSNSWSLWARDTSSTTFSHINAAQSSTQTYGTGETFFMLQSAAKTAAPSQTQSQSYSAFKFRPLGFGWLSQRSFNQSNASGGQWAGGTPLASPAAQRGTLANERVPNWSLLAKPRSDYTQSYRE